MAMTYKLHFTLKYSIFKASAVCLTWAITRMRRKCCVRHNLWPLEWQWLPWSGDTLGYITLWQRSYSSLSIPLCEVWELLPTLYITDEMSSPGEKLSSGWHNWLQQGRSVCGSEATLLRKWRVHSSIQQLSFEYLQCARHSGGLLSAPLVLPWNGPGRVRSVFIY